MDRIERTPDDVVAQDGHPLREVRMERHLTLDRHVHSRGFRLPDDLAESARIGHAISQPVGGRGRSAATDGSRGQGGQPRGAPELQLGVPGDRERTHVAVRLAPTNPGGADAVLARADPERIFAQGDPAGDAEMR